MELTIPVNNLTKTKLKILNCFINNLTDIELDIVSTMIDKGIVTLDKSNRNTLRTSLNMNKYLFNNYIKYLKDKKVLFTNESILTLNPSILNITKDNKITIELKQK